MRVGSVDLIYLDPPFNSNREYNAIYKDETGRPLPDQIEAFCDLWELTEERERALRNMPVLMRESGIDDATVEFWRLWMNALRGTQPRLLAYLSYMVERLLQMKVILKPTGSLYLHCDPTASHYIKAMLDAIFGHKNFRNEIVWQKIRSSKAQKSGFGAVHDTIFLYRRSANSLFNKLYTSLPDKRVKTHYGKVEPETGRRYGLYDFTQAGPGKPRRFGDREIAPPRGKHWIWSQDRIDDAMEDGRLVFTGENMVRVKRYLDESRGNPVEDIWTDIPPINSMAKERMGYATQKPLALMERIIQASSNPGDVVLDPFCGCATTLEAAERLGRKWIGIDIAIHAIKRVAKIRLQDRLGLVEGTDFTVEGVPRNLEGARDLWERDKYHFQKWAVEQVDGFVTTRRTADGGIDGRLYFRIPGERDLQSMALEVKGGSSVNISVVRDLRGVLERDNALMAGLIVMEPLSHRKSMNFVREMSSAGDLMIEGLPYPKMQMLTVQDILDGKRFKTPGAVGRGERQPALPFG
ncbi:MAG: DNA methyltransferase [Bryobacterales bacterium]|nr:DNA methyltransferase [Bryobacterales bacterium]MDE0294194.1 DNA methyltransferase [Bryobacterales bacterium]